MNLLKWIISYLVVPAWVFGVMVFLPYYTGSFLDRNTIHGSDYPQDLISHLFTMWFYGAMGIGAIIAAFFILCAVLTVWIWMGKATEKALGSKNLRR